MVNPVTSYSLHMQQLLQKDNSRNLMEITRLVVDCFHKDRMSLQTIENTLRTHKCYTYLIARGRNPAHASSIQYLKDGTIVPYHLFISTQSEETSKKEIEIESKNYDDNFQKLNDTGFAVIAPNASLMESLKGGVFELSQTSVQHLPTHPQNEKLASAVKKQLENKEQNATCAVNMDDYHARLNLLKKQTLGARVLQLLNPVSLVRFLLLKILRAFW